MQPCSCQTICQITAQHVSNALHWKQAGTWQCSSKNQGSTEPLLDKEQWRRC